MMTRHQIVLGAAFALCTLANAGQAEANGACTKPRVEVSGNDAKALWVNGNCRIKLVGPASDFRAIKGSSYTYRDLPKGSYKFRVRTTSSKYSDKAFKIASAGGTGSSGGSNDNADNGSTNDKPVKSTGRGVPIILDTDFGGDVDDVGTVAVLNELHNRGEARMLAVMSVAWSKHAVSGISAINSFYGNSSVPIGRHARGAKQDSTAYDKYIAQHHKHNQTAAKAPSSTQLYRKILASQPDNSIVIVTVGQLRNIEALLKSKSDSASSMGGAQLFNRKVKRLHIMGGHYPRSTKGAEVNLRNSGKGVARFVVNSVNVPIVFNGFEIGSKGAGYSTGDKLDKLPLSNPVARGYHYFFEIKPPRWVNKGKPYKSIQEWSTWDQIALIYAVRQNSSYFGTVTRGYNDVQSTGHNSWRNTPDKKHTYLVKKMKPKTFADQIIEPLMIK